MQWITWAQRFKAALWSRLWQAAARALTGVLRNNQMKRSILGLSVLLRLPVTYLHDPLALAAVSKIYFIFNYLCLRLCVSVCV